MRFERKFRIEGPTYDEVRQVLITHPAGFRKTYNDRWINTLYLDTPNFDFFRDTTQGMATRYKPRIRWYGRDITQALVPTLEIKTKKNKGRSKHLDILPEFFIEDDFSFKEYVREHLNRPEFAHLIPSVLVRYERSYFESANGLVRATLDRNLMYFPVTTDANLGHKPYQDSAIILEIKYVTASDAEVDFITQYLPFRLTKSSKYATAVKACYE